MPWLEWNDRNEDLKATAKTPYRLLQPVQSLAYGEPDAPNMLIQGDNLEALKALLPYYAGQVKCIFIDPPYNTKSAFEHYDDNLEHSQWLSMMYPRLVLLRELLAQDGSIWVTIDDNEGHYLKVMMDEVFGRSNFVANTVWQKKYTIANDAKWLSDNHDHVLIYAKTKDSWRPRPLPRTDEMNARYRNPDRHAKGPWKATPLHAKSGSEANRTFTYTFKNGVVWAPPPGTFPRYSAETLRRYDNGDEIWFGKDGAATPSRKTFLSELSNEGTPSPTIWLHSDVGNNHEARDEVKAFNADEPFGTPKPERLLQRILHLATKPNDLVLDSFLGSGTTAAVAHKMGRRWIGIEMGDHARTHSQPRMVKVVNGEQGGVSEAVSWKSGGGFRFYTLGPKVFDDQGRINPDIKFEHLAAHIWFAETGSARSSKAMKSPLLGVHEGTAYYLLFNGILGDTSVGGGNVLTLKLLGSLSEHNGPKVIYGEGTNMTKDRLRSLGITFKQTPYDIKAR